jgi:hypothetical protein
MVKHTGQQQASGIPYKPNLDADRPQSANPSAKTKQRIQDHDQLRIHLEKNTSGMFINLMIKKNVNLVSIAIQARAFAFVQGFLPNVAHKQFNVAQKSNIINDFGRPNFSSFVAFAYSAGLHVDEDECVSHGWI